MQKTKKGFLFRRMKRTAIQLFACILFVSGVYVASWLIPDIGNSVKSTLSQSTDIHSIRNEIVPFAEKVYGMMAH